MRIKKYSAPTLKEAVEKMKKELGSDAIVLQSRKLKPNGIFDQSGKEEMEVIAAVDNVEKGIEHVEESTYTPKRETAELCNHVKEQEIDLLKDEIGEIKNTVVQIADFLRYKNLPSLPENLLLVLKQLIDCDVDEVLAKRIVQEIQMDLKGDDYQDLRFILKRVIAKISGLIKNVRAKNKNNSQAKIIAFVGPTGVGKTTTLAKLATKAKLLRGKKVAIISADTFRIAAVEQLKTFATIADIPFEVVYSQEDIKKAVLKFSDMDHIFIDTTGRSQRDKSNLEDIKNMLASIEPGEVHLVLSATTKQKDMHEILEKFKGLFINRLIFTKIDETTTLGLILNVAERTRKPISFITFGQNVPEDIDRINPAKIAKMILRRNSL